MSSSCPKSCFGRTHAYQGLEDTEPASIPLDPLPPRAAPAVDPAHRDHVQHLCARCHTYYTEATQSTCVHHAGVYRDVGYTGGRTGNTTIGWSCCKDVLEGYGLERDTPGCQQAVAHVPDVHYAVNTAYFPFDPIAAQTAVHVRDVEGEEGEEEEEEEEEQVLMSPTPGAAADEDKPSWYVHTVRATDTLAGLAIRYGVSSSALRRANALPMHSDLLHHRTEVLIPLAPEDALLLAPPPPVEGAALRKRMFARRTGCSVFEAGYYLEEAEQDVDRAVALWEEDTAWEAQAQAQQPRGQSRFMSVKEIISV